MRHVLIIAFIFTAFQILAQTPPGVDLLYDMGIMIQDTVSNYPDTDSDPAAPQPPTEEQLRLQMELDQYQVKLIETELQLKNQTNIIDSLHAEIDRIITASKTDHALLETRITKLVSSQDEQQKIKPIEASTPDASADSAWAELLTDNNAETPLSRPVPSGEPLTRLQPAEEYNMYRSALKNFHKENYYAAIEGFATVAKRGSDLTLQANSYYWIGCCLYAKEFYDEAITSFEQVQKYSFSDKQDDALVMIGMAFKKKNKISEAKLVFRELVERHPGSEYLILAKRIIHE